MPYNKILIAVDSSEYSISAAKKGLELAHLLNAKVALIYVIDISKGMGNFEAGITPQEALIVLKKEAEQAIDLLASYNGVNLVKMMPEGHPNEDIIKAADTWEADLIVMGTHGRTGLLHLLVGSVAEHTLKHSKIPVMVVPSK
ncbi:MAG: universal stress protein [Bacteroidetes bacterium]|nr:universal stress protein [Bacteroidota bacterium]